MLFGEFAKSQAEAEYPELWRGLVGAWSPCLNPRGTMLYDLSGRGNHGTLTNMDPATDWVGGGYQALDFDGVNDQLTFSQTGRVSTYETTGKFTLELWMVTRPTMPTFAIPLGYTDPGSAAGIRFWMSSVTSLNFSYNAYNAENITVTIPSASLVHVVGTYDLVTMRVYVNGAMVSTRSSTSAVSFTSAVTRIGNGTGWAAFNGQIYDAKIYTDVWSARQVSIAFCARPGGWATPRRRRWNYATAQTAIPYWVFARKNARLIGGGVT